MPETTPVLALPYPVGSDLADIAAAIQALAEQLEAVRGAVGGLAPLGDDGLVPAEMVPAAPIASAMTPKGVWNAATNTPALADGTGTLGDLYRVGTAGSQNLGSGATAFAVNDIVWYADDDKWHRQDTTDDVISVNGQTGAVTLNASSVSAVGLTGAQTVAGVKTFSSSPVVPTPTAGSTGAANAAYVDDAISDALAGISGGSMIQTGVITGGPGVTSGDVAFANAFSVAPQVSIWPSQTGTGSAVKVAISSVTTTGFHWSAESSNTDWAWLATDGA